MELEPHPYHIDYASNYKCKSRTYSDMSRRKEGRKGSASATMHEKLASGAASTSLRDNAQPENLVEQRDGEEKSAMGQQTAMGRVLMIAGTKIV
eukprot:CAMPEP_0178992342 /NCGR_PEP_ID=MMETSP0795-20121207/6059_1 /TAXON_ID=88552 /ORGANISM="Amoebophrya sp., Strain Ameob2" /LENGTH=93 /DNA_ID=CAMNT_0020684209 /DNA_START=664 /DNA_END=945 /DNA_ORIENTATION=+